MEGDWEKRRKSRYTLSRLSLSLEHGDVPLGLRLVASPLVSDDALVVHTGGRLVVVALHDDHSPASPALAPRPEAALRLSGSSSALRCSSTLCCGNTSALAVAQQPALETEV